VALTLSLHYVQEICLGQTFAFWLTCGSLYNQVASIVVVHLLGMFRNH
jgi:thiosulfate reductase cytochrome b subunit